MADIDAAEAKSIAALNDARAAEKQAREALDVARPSVSAVVRDVAEVREELGRLKRERSDQERREAEARAVRLMQYGVSVGVAAMLYTPGPWGNTLDGVAGGAMPYIAIHPAYWRDDEATNLFCALQWSTSDARAVANANQVQREAEAQEGTVPDESGGSKQPERTAEEAERVLEDADRAARDAEAAQNDLQAARVAEEKIGAAGVPAEMDTAKSEVKKQETRLAQQTREAQQKAQAAKSLVEELEAARARSQARRAAKLERKYVKDMRGLREEKVDELEVTLKTAVLDGDQRDALVAHAESSFAATEGREEDERRSRCVETVNELLDATGWKCPSNSAPKAAELACEIARTRREIVELSIEADGYRGEGTSCAAHKFGVFAGYPGVFSATSVIVARTAQDRETRELTPIVSFGFAFSPNAITSVVSGPWLATTNVDGTAEFVWGMNVGFALTTDVFAALAD
jgi:hypothetical protein